MLSQSTFSMFAASLPWYKYIDRCDIEWLQQGAFRTAWLLQYRGLRAMPSQPAPNLPVRKTVRFNQCCFLVFCPEPVLTNDPFAQQTSEKRPKVRFSSVNNDITS